MTTLEKIESLIIPEEKAREIITEVDDVLIQVVVKNDGDSACRHVSAYGCWPSIMRGIHELLSEISERTEYSVPELAKMIVMVAEMGGKQ